MNTDQLLLQLAARGLSSPQIAAYLALHKLKVTTRSGQKPGGRSRCAVIRRLAYLGVKSPGKAGRPRHDRPMPALVGLPNG